MWELVLQDRIQNLAGDALTIVSSIWHINQMTKIQNYIFSLIMQFYIPRVPQNPLTIIIFQFFRTWHIMVKIFDWPPTQIYSAQMLLVDIYHN